MSDSETDTEAKVVTLVPTQKKTGPKFAPETEITDRCLVVDLDGQGWWIDPHARTIVKVEI